MRPRVSHFWHDFVEKSIHVRPPIEQAISMHSWILPLRLASALLLLGIHSGSVPAPGSGSASGCAFILLPVMAVALIVALSIILGLALAFAFASIALMPHHLQNLRSASQQCHITRILVQCNPFRCFQNKDS